MQWSPCVPPVFRAAFAEYAGGLYLQSVTISSKRAELETLNEQVAQQQTENQELQRVLSGDADQITEWVARDSYNYAAPNERIFVDVTGN
mgnify:FL=1